MRLVRVPRLANTAAPPVLRREPKPDQPKKAARRPKRTAQRPSRLSERLLIDQAMRQKGKFAQPEAKTVASWRDELPFSSFGEGAPLPASRPTGRRRKET